MSDKEDKKSYFISSSKKLFTNKKDDKNEHYFDGSTEIKFDGSTEEKKNGEVKAEFEKLVHSQVSKIINQKYDDIVLLSGAGSSICSDGNFGKTVSQIAEIIFEKMKNKDGLEVSEKKARSNVYSLSELANKTRYEEVDENGKLKGDFELENFISHLIRYKSFAPEKGRKKFEKSLNEILECIRDNTTYDYDSSKLKHAKVINTLSRKLKAPHKLSIVTTNYDVLFEEAAMSENYTVFDGFTFSEKPVFDEGMFDWNLVREIPNIHTKEVEYKDKVINLLKIHGSLTWEKGEDGQILRKDKESIEEIDKMVMIFPSSDKYAQSYQTPYFALFAKFQELLRRPNTLLISTGFSFSDDHIAQMVIEAVKNNPGLTLLITDFNIDQTSKNWQALLDLMEANHPVSFLKATLNDDLASYLGEQDEY
ncbi:SIR2 family protein [Limosilactobacillus ingluviei]